MPTTLQILELPERVSNELIVVTVIFHLLSFAFLISLAASWKPVLGLFYGVFGMCKLHILIDGALFAGALALGFMAQWC